MAEKNIDFQMVGRLILVMDIEALTGLHIGSSGGSLEIGGMDNPVIRNPISEQPYIPGSSLRGKMRSQLEKLLGVEQNRRVGQAKIHVCDTAGSYATCSVCQIFGLPGEDWVDAPTRLIVRDVPMTLESEEILLKAHTDAAYTEVKTEVAIDRITSKAAPRNIERVPAGAVFGPAELVFSIFKQTDLDNFKFVLDALQLVEDDYLGGSGSRGSGKVAFTNLNLIARDNVDYSQTHAIGSYHKVDDATTAFSDIRAKSQALLFKGA